MFYPDGNKEEGIWKNDELENNVNINYPNLVNVY